MELDKKSEQKEQISKSMIEPEIDKLHEAISEVTKTDDMEFIMETEKSMTRERKIDLIKWTEIQKFHEQLDAQEEKI
jgi:hypothetical protein